MQIDKRFAHMLRDERFSSKAKVDRYGRKLPKDSGRKELERFYRVEEDGLGDEEDEIDNDEEVEKEVRRVEGSFDHARDGGFSESSSDESSEDEETEVEEEEVFGFADQQGDAADGIPSGEITSRIAVVNLDWDNIRAADLMAVFSSFAPGNGRILKVSVYPSEFGKERMEKEETEGPPKEIFAHKGSDDKADAALLSSDDDNELDGDEEEEEKIKKSILKEDQGEEFNSAKLRRYQLERLRYYYAVLSCSSKDVGESIYNTVDGTEYLTTANFFDLRFIPDDMNFTDDKPRDECERIPDGYKPNEFVTDALQHSKVKLTWDADDGTRKEAQKRAFGGSRADIDENDLKAYLGSDSSDDEESDLVQQDTSKDDATNEDATSAANPKLSKKDVERQRMRSLLGLGDQPVPSRKSNASGKAPVGDLQITFSSGLSGDQGGSIFENEPLTEETTVERYVRKEKERKARRKEKMKATRNGTEPVDDANAAEDDEASAEMAEPSDLGFSDPFFTAPADDKAATSALRKEAKRLKRASLTTASATTSAQRAELELLMDDPTSANPSAPVNHFNINEIARAEKALKKKKHPKRMTAREKEAVEAKEKDGFKMDVEDPRFRAVFERSEFAIDPSSAKFKGTEGMKALLEEGRRKRRRGSAEEGEGEEVRKKGRKETEDEDDGVEVEKLVARVKRKTKGRGRANR